MQKKKICFWAENLEGKKEFPNNNRGKVRMTGNATLGKYLSHPAVVFK